MTDLKSRVFNAITRATSPNGVARFLSLPDREHVTDTVMDVLRPELAALEQENQQLRGLVAAATRYQHPDAPRAVVDKVGHNPTMWRVRRLGAGDSGEDYEDLAAALARARELAT